MLFRSIVGKWVPFEFAVVNETSVATIASVALPVGRSEEAIESGGVLIDAQNGGADFRNLQYQIMEGVPEAQWPAFVRSALAQTANSTGSNPSPATPAETAPETPSAGSSASATKEMPFVNMLGMKFVPVAGTKVLFSI